MKPAGRRARACSGAAAASLYSVALIGCSDVQRKMCVMIRARLFRLAALSAAFLCGVASPSDAQQRKNATPPQFDVPAVAQDPSCPPQGWCGEASLQMIFMYYGAYYPQRVINAAGKPEHPDLWSNNMGAAMQALGFKWTDYPAGDTEDYIRHLKADLAAGLPVFMGVMVSSDAHFCVAAKCDDASLTIHTTWSMQPTVYPWSKLRTQVPGAITLVGAFMGFTVQVPVILGKYPLRLYPAEPSRFFDKKCKLRIAASNLKKGARYQIRSYASVREADDFRGSGNLVDDFTASDTEYGKIVEVDRDQPIVFVLTRYPRV